MFFRNDVLKLCSKFTGEHPCRNAISIKLQSNFIEITLRHGCSPVNLLQVFRTPFPKNTSWRLLLKTLHRRCLRGFRTCSRFGSEYTRVFIIPRCWIYQDYTGFWTCLNNSWIWLIMPECAGICLSILEYAGIWMNMPNFSWVILVLHFSIAIPCYLNVWSLF